LKVRLESDFGESASSAIGEARFMIDFTRAFDSAWERMMIILFRPFDLGKWFAIGLSAFLAGLLQGGNGINGSFNTNFNNSFNRNGTYQPPSVNWNQLHSSISNTFSSLQLGMIILIFAAVFVFIIVVSILYYWLGSRGQFLLLDNIVRNRAAITWPWQYYARQANSLFVFYLVVFAIALVVFIPILVVGVVMAIPLFEQDRWPMGGEITGFVLLGLVYLALAIGFNFVLFVFREFGVPLMFRNGLMARAAFFESMGLLGRHPGCVIVFVLLRFVISIAVIVLSIIACCCTCCVGSLPYLGTVVLLPALIYVRCFSLDCLAQFGPQYDAWTVDVPAAGPAGTTEPLSPPPPPG
jgi:hypothetical protein